VDASTGSAAQGWLRGEGELELAHCTSCRALRKREHRLGTAEIQLLTDAHHWAGSDRQSAS